VVDSVSREISVGAVVWTGMLEMRDMLEVRANSPWVDGGDVTS